MNIIDDYVDDIEKIFAEGKCQHSLSKLEKIQTWGILYKLRQETVDVVMEIVGKLAEENWEKEKQSNNLPAQ